MGRELIGVVVGLVFVVLACGFLFFVEGQGRRECEQRGGVYKFSRDGSLCLNPEALK